MMTTDGGAQAGIDEQSRETLSAMAEYYRHRWDAEIGDAALADEALAWVDALAAQVAALTVERERLRAVNRRCRRAMRVAIAAIEDAGTTCLRCQDEKEAVRNILIAARRWASARRESMSIDEDRLLAIGMAAFHRVATAINLYEDITPHAGRIPFSELPDVDRAWWHQRAQRMIDLGAIDLTTHRPKREARHADH